MHAAHASRLGLRRSCGKCAGETSAPAEQGVPADGAAPGEKRSRRGNGLESALELLAADAFHPVLRTHKLKGKLANSWACSAGYDLRIVFQFTDHGTYEAILLEAVGTHDEVY